jgi:hypothetical protein
MKRVHPLLVGGCAAALFACGSKPPVVDAGTTSANCRQIGQVNGSIVNVFQDVDPPTGNPLINQVYMGLASEPPDAGTFDLLIAEYYWSSPAIVPTPHAHTITSGERYDTCAECITLRTQCLVGVNDAGTPTLQCAKRFFGQSGQLTYTTFGTSIDGGVMQGSGSNVRLVEWQYGSVTGADFAVAGGDCVDLAGYSYNLTYSSNGVGGFSWDAGP